MKRLTLALLMLAACHRTQVPLDTQLWRIDGAWLTPNGANVRTAPATILVFRSSGEYVELHCQLVERADETVYIRDGSRFISAVGRWTQNGDTINAAREKIGQNIAKPISGPVHPLCRHAQLT